jgi:hypothetical protein
MNTEYLFLMISSSYGFMPCRPEKIAEPLENGWWVKSADPNIPLPRREGSLFQRI